MTAYRRGRVFAIAVLLSIIAIVIGVALAILYPIRFDSGGEIVGGALRYSGLITAILAFFALLVTATGTASTILLGWRADRRQADEFKLKIEQLELQLTEARAKSALLVPAAEPTPVIDLPPQSIR